MASQLEKLNSKEAVPAFKVQADNNGHTPDTVLPQSKIQTLGLDVSTVGYLSSSDELPSHLGRSSPHEEPDGSASTSYHPQPVAEEELLMPTPAKVTKLSTQHQHRTTKDNEFSIYRCLQCNLYLPSLILIQAHLLSHTDKELVQVDKKGYSSDPVSQKPSSDDNLPMYAYIGTFGYNYSTFGNICNATSKRLGISLSAEKFPDKEMPLTSYTRGDNSTFDSYRKVCTFCKVTITSELCFINHLLLYHHKEFQKEDLFHCPVCPNLFFDSFFKSELKSHVKKIHKLSIRKCISCEEIFDSYKSLFLHRDRPNIYNLLDDDLLRYRCETCRVFHVLNNVQDKRSLMEEILNTLPKDTSITEFEAKHAKLRKSLLSENIYADIYICKICDIDFPGLTCTVNHVINTHFGGLTEKTKLICHTSKKQKKCRLCHIRHEVRADDIQSIKNEVTKRDEKNEPFDAAVLSKDQLYILEIIHEKTMEYSNKGVDEFLTCKVNKYSCHKCNIYLGWYICFLNHILNIHLDEDIGAKIEKMHVFRKSEALYACCLCKSKHSIVCVEKSVFMFYLKLKNMDFENASRELKKWCFRQELRNYICPKYKRFSSIQKTAGNTTIPSRTKLEIMTDMKERIVCIDNSFVCFVCLLGFDRFSCCNNHVLTCHAELFVYAPGSEVYTCQVCQAVFSCLTSLNVHLETEHLIFKFLCLKCYTKFNTQKKLKYHTEQHGKNLVKIVFDGQLSCKRCGHIHNCAVNEKEEMEFKCEKQDIDSELLECLRLSKYRITSCPLLDNCDPQPPTFYNLNHSSDLNTENLSEKAFDLANTEQQFVCKNTYTGQDNLESNEKVQSKECENCISTSDHYEKNDLYMNTLFDGKTFYCLKCLKGFETVSCCFSHIGWFHVRQLETSCVICEESFVDKMLLIKHVKSLHNIEPFYCKMCKEGFDSVVDITKHIENCQERKMCPELSIHQLCTNCYTHHLTGFELDQTDTCQECVEGFASLKCVTNHYYSIHLPSWVMLASDTTTFKCPCCGITFNTKQILKRHMENCYTEKMPKKETHKFKNNILAEEKTLKQNEKETETSAEETKSAYESCVGCRSIHVVDCNFESPSSFSLTLEQNRTLICETCRQVFQTDDCLQSHLLLCTYKGRKPCQCIACGLYFMNLEALESHQNKTVEEVVGPRKCKRNQDILPCIKCSEVHLIVSSYREMTVKNGKSLEEISLQRYCEQYINGSSGCEQYSQNGRLVLSCPQSVKSNPHAQRANFKFVNKETCPICQGFVPEKERVQHVFLQHCKLTETQGDVHHGWSEHYSCIYCDKTFLLPVDAQLHLRLKHFRKPLIVRNHQKHSDRKAVADILHCPFCFKTFYDGETTLKMHIMVHVQKLRDCWCVICKKSFRNINFHKRLHSENTILNRQQNQKRKMCLKKRQNQKNKMCMNKPQNQKRIMCDKCGKFVTDTGFARHKLLHTAKANNYCHICCKIIHGNMTIHKRLHRRMCDICGKTVLHLRTHIEAVHFRKTKVCQLCGLNVRLHNFKQHMKSKHQALY